MEKRWPLREARSKFSELVARAQQGEVQVITKRGEPVVVAMDYVAYQQLQVKPLSALEALRGDPNENPFEGMTNEEIDALFPRLPLKMRPVDL
jgi:prevent-host-death family protein